MYQRVREAPVGRLATVSADQRPHLVPCCFVLDGSRDGVIWSAVDRKPKTTQALRRLTNLRTNPAVSLIVDHYVDDWAALWWVRVDGDGRVVEPGPERDKALTALAAKYHQYRSQPPPGPVIGIDVTGWRAWP